MSIRNRLSRGRHLDEAELASAWTDATLAGGAVADAHVAECAQCRARMDAFTAWMDDLHLEGIADADAAFPAERLAAQQAHILRRLETAEHPARVIAFPTSSRPMSKSTSHVRRWIAAAAAAGLIVGVGVGQLMNLRHTMAGPGSALLRGIDPPRSDRPVSRVQPNSASMNDTDGDALMADIDASLSRNSLSELHAIDAITPRAQFEGRQR